MKEELLRKKEELMGTVLDSYGMSKFDRASREEISRVTEFDSFVFQDTLRYAALENSHIEHFRTANATRINPETGLFAVTVRDLATTYYEYATMFNRLENRAYASRVYESCELLRRLIIPMRNNIYEEIKNAVATNGSDEAYKKDGRFGF